MDPTRTKSPTILMVDHEPRYQQLIKSNLVAAGFYVCQAESGEAAIAYVADYAPDLVLLDLLLPKISGFTVCERIRSFSNTPIVFLTAKADEASRVKGLNLGADDYISKPFSAEELIARVRAILRRREIPRQSLSQRFFTHGDLKIDFDRAEVWVGNQPAQLTATEYKLLLQFVQNVGQVMSTDQLLKAVWGPGYAEYREVLWVCLARLRHKLEVDSQAPLHIVSLPKQGYIMPGPEVMKIAFPSI